MVCTTHCVGGRKRVLEAILLLGAGGGDLWWSGLHVKSSEIGTTAEQQGRGLENKVTGAGNPLLLHF